MRPEDFISYKAVIKAVSESRAEALLVLQSTQLNTPEQTDAEAALNNIAAWLGEALTELVGEEAQ